MPSGGQGGQAAQHRGRGRVPSETSAPPNPQSATSLTPSTGRRCVHTGRRPGNLRSEGPRQTHGRVSRGSGGPPQPPRGVCERERARRCHRDAACAAPGPGLAAPRQPRTARARSLSLRLPCRLLAVCRSHRHSDRGAVAGLSGVSHMSLNSHFLSRPARTRGGVWNRDRQCLVLGGQSGEGGKTAWATQAVPGTSELPGEGSVFSGFSWLLLTG